MKLPESAAVKTKALLTGRKGDGAVGFIVTTALLMFLFAAMLSTMIYVMAYFNAGYACRRIVRDIETTGKYDTEYAETVLNRAESPNLRQLSAVVEAEYLRDNLIQLRDPFTVTVDGSYTLNIAQLGAEPITFTLPVTVKIAGMSEVYFK